MDEPTYEYLEIMEQDDDEEEEEEEYYPTGDGINDNLLGDIF